MELNPLGSCNFLNLYKILTNVVLKAFTLLYLLKCKFSCTQTTVEFAKNSACFATYCTVNICNPQYFILKINQ